MLRHSKQIAYDCALGVDWPQTAKAKKFEQTVTEEERYWSHHSLDKAASRRKPCVCFDS
jgi:hypothetical protein